MPLFRRHSVIDYTKPAEALILGICERYSLRVEKCFDAPVELLLHIPVQDGLSVKVVVGLQNNDELNLGVGDFWSYFFPFEKKKEIFARGLEGFIRGDCRIVEYRRRPGQRAIRCALQSKTPDGWETLYEHSTLFAWCRKPEVTYIMNEATEGNGSFISPKERPS